MILFCVEGTRMAEQNPEVVVVGGGGGGVKKQIWLKDTSSRAIEKQYYASCCFSFLR